MAAERHSIELTRANRDAAHRGVDAAIAKAATGSPWVLELREATRSDAQNAALHGLIGQIMKQRTHHNGVRMTMPLWKAVFVEALGEEVRFVPKLGGDGMFPIGLSTSALSKSRFADLITLILAWSTQEGLTVEHFEDAAEPAREAA